MADSPVKQIVAALAEALGQITIANGYNTDIGQTVQTERSQARAVATPLCTVGCVSKHRGEDGQNRPGNGRSIRGVIEIEIPASYDTAMETLYDAEEDVDACLRAYHQMPNALPVQYDEAVFLDRPEGVAVVAAEIHWSTAYRSRSGS